MYIGFYSFFASPASIFDCTIILILLWIALDSLTEIVIGDFGLACAYYPSTLTLRSWISWLNMLFIDLPSLSTINCGLYTFKYLTNLVGTSIILHILDNTFRLS